MERKVIIFLMVPFLLFWHWFEPAAKKNRQGIKAFQDQKYEEALKQFMSARGVKPDMAELKNNTAASLYQMKKYKEALEEFSGIDPETAGISKSDFYYNLGNSFFRTNQFPKALENYKKALVLAPSDMDLKKNFEITLKKMEQQKQKQKQDKKNKKDKEKEQQKDQQKDKDKQQNKDKQDKPDQQQQKQQQQKHKNILQYLNQKEKEQQKKKKVKGVGVAKNEKDW
jgi:tetratricopeptide (TPR) repeat protein